MKKISSLLFVFIILVFISEGKNTVIGKLTSLRTCFDVKHYGIAVKVNPNTKTIAGLNNIFFQAVNDFSSLQIDFVASMQIDSLVYENKKINYKRKGNAMFVDFKTTLLKNSFHHLKIYFSGMPHVAELPPWKGGFVWEKDNDQNDWVGLACEGIGASVWLPCKDHWSDEADSMDMNLIVPEGLVGVSNGKLIRHGRTDDGYHTYHWQVRNTINNYNISINVGKYVELHDTFNGIHKLPLSYYVLKYNRVKADKHFKQVHAMLAAFEHYFGGYPFYEDSYKLVETSYWGMEHQSCVAYGNHYQNNAFDFDFIIIHESGHEWFANSITASDPADMWIHESFTTYSEALFVEYNYGKEKAIEYLQTQRNKIIAKKPMLGPLGEYYHGFTDNDIYYKGAWMLHTMRSVLNNDSLWFTTIRNLSEHFKHQIVNTKDIIQYFNVATGHNWDLFFKQYLNKGQLPQLKYKSETDKDGITRIHYQWANVNKDFNMPLLVYTNIEKTSSTWIYPTGKKQILVLENSGAFIVANELFLVELKENN